MVEWQEVRGAWMVIAVGFLLMLASLILALLDVSMGILIVPLIAGGVLVVGTTLHLRIWVIKVSIGSREKKGV
jgi:hypothetical protein